MAISVIFLDEAAEWFLGLDEAKAEKVTFYVDLLKEEGVALGAPYSSALHGSDYAFRELRVKAPRSVIRIVYAFDPAQNAVVILGADKKGQKQDRFYKNLIKRAERLWKEYLEQF
jgi:hypothetical protein